MKESIKLKDNEFILNIIANMDEAFAFCEIRSCFERILQLLIEMTHLIIEFIKSL